MNEEEVMDWLRAELRNIGVGKMPNAIEVSLRNRLRKTARELLVGVEPEAMRPGEEERGKGSTLENEVRTLRERIRRLERLAKRVNETRRNAEHRSNGANPGNGNKKIPREIPREVPIEPGWIPPQIRDAFNRLLGRRRLLKMDPPPDPRQPATLVLSGGTLKGSFQVGALLYMRDAGFFQRYRIRDICATSVGALTALAFSAEGPEAIERVVRLFLGLRSLGDLFEPAPWTDDVNRLLGEHFGTNIWELLGTGPGRGIEDALSTLRDVKAVGLLGLLSGLLGYIILLYTAWSIEEKLEALQEILEIVSEAESLFIHRPLRQMLFTNIDAARIGVAASLRIATVGLSSGRLAYVTEDAELMVGAASVRSPDYKGGGAIVDPPAYAIFEGALASATMPGILPPIYLGSDDVGSDRYVDGGARELAPMVAAAEVSDRGSPIVAILASSPEPMPAGPMETSSGLAISSRSLDIALNEVLQNDINPAGGWCDDFTRMFIYPELHVHDSMTVDPGLIRINVAYGYMRAYFMYQAQTGGLDGLGPWRVFLTWLALDVIAELRMHAWSLEEQVVGEEMRYGRPPRRDSTWSHLGSEPLFRWGPTFHEDILAEIRQTKQATVDMVDGVIGMLRDDTSIVPIQIPGPGGPEPITRWWESWERHTTELYRVLRNFDLWEPLPLMPTTSGQEVADFESPDDIPRRPTSNYF